MTAAKSLATRAGRFGAVYALGRVLTVALGLVTVTAYTRLMPPSEFGVLAVLTAIATVLTMLCTVGVVQGVLGTVFGRTDDDGGDDEAELDGDAAPRAGAKDSVGAKREALGTGLVLILGITAAMTTAAWLALPTIVDLANLGEGYEMADLRLALLLGASGALLRPLLMLPRLERRAKTFVTLETLRLGLGLAIGIPFVAAGQGAGGAIKGLLIATALMVVGALFVMRRSYRIAFRARMLPGMARQGAMFVPLQTSLWVMTSVGVILIAGFVPSAEIGFYRVAVTFGGLILQSAGVLFAAWLPLKRTSVYRAASKERGPGWISSNLATWSLIAWASMLVVLIAAADAVVRIAGPMYTEAAALIPAVGAAALMHCCFLLVYRISAFPRKRVVLALAAPMAAAIFVALTLLLAPSLGIYSLPVARIAGFAPALLVVLAFGQLGRRPVPFESGRIARLALVTAGCATVHHFAADAAGALAPLVDAGVVVVFFVLLFALRVLTPAQVKMMARVIRAALRPQRRDRSALRDRLAQLDPEELGVLHRALGPRAARAPLDPPPPGEVARLLRPLAGGEERAHPADGPIGEYIVSPLSRAERDVLARALWARGVDAGELDRLEEVANAMRRLPASAWRVPEAPQVPR